MNNDKAAEKPVWIKPTLRAHRSGLLNKFGTVPARQWQDEFEGVPVNEIVERYGSPVFVVSEKRLRENLRHMARAFASRYPRVQPSWSYKTNYLNAVCSILHQEGAWAEVVSAFEYQKARSLGVPGDKILFNGPHKPRHILETAIDEGAHIHVDHLDELQLIDQIAREKSTTVELTIRLNFDTGVTETWGRFGFNIESGQALDAAWRIAHSPNLKLTGLHSHIGTFITDTRAYRAQVKAMCSFMDRAESETGCEIEMIDVGGGFASRNALQGIYLPPEQVVPSIDQYAEAICDSLLEATHHRERNGRQRPMLFLESGRAVIDDAEILLTSVVGNKRLADGRRGVILDAGVNLLFTAFWYHHSVKPTHELNGVAEETVLYGPLCMNIDVMRASIMLPPLSVGDVLLFSPVGAYNNTQWLQFIEYRPNVVLIHQDQQTSIIRAAEDLAAVTAQERLPAHLGNSVPDTDPS